MKYLINIYEYSRCLLFVFFAGLFFYLIDVNLWNALWMPVFVIIETILTMPAKELFE